jgi:hypothetical protein
MSTQNINTTSSFARILLGACAGAALIGVSAISAQAFPAGTSVAAPDARVILVEGDCGVGRWRGPEGHCHLDRERIVVDPLLPVVPPVVVETPVVKVCPIHMHWSDRRRECVYN